MPGARCTRGLVCNMHKRKRTRAYRFSGGNPAFPAQWLYGLWRAPPENRALLSPSPHGNRHVGPVGPFAPPRDLTPTAEASGPHAFAVRFGAVVLRAGNRSRVYARPAITCRADAIASIASHPTHVTIAIRPCGRVRPANLESDLPASQSEILPVGLICRRRDAIATCSPGKCRERRQSPCPVRRNPTCLRLLPVAATDATVRSQRVRSPSKSARPTHIAGWTQPRSLLFLACYPAAALISCGEAVRSGRRPSSPCFLSGGSPAYRRNASAIRTRPLTPVITTSTMVKEAWKWPRALICWTGTPAAAKASA